MSSSSAPEGLVIDQTTILSLLSTLAILAAAYLASLYTLPSTASTKTRFLFIWHAFDALIHFILEGTFLYNCFFSFGPTLLTEPLLPANVFFLGRAGRNYGAAYGEHWHSALWREYAKADRRWAGTDLTVVSLELLTVFVGGPLACWICSQLVKERWGSAWFWMCVLATGELYGGFMTFVPEWLSGSPNLVTSNWMYKWVYLFFFNTIWVWIPLWILYQGYGVFTSALNTTASKQKRR
ncbi:ebp domain-containing protein, partial [Aureobasidium melanogenum]